MKKLFSLAVVLIMMLATMLPTFAEDIVIEDIAPDDVAAVEIVTDEQVAADEIQVDVIDETADAVSNDVVEVAMDASNSNIAGFVERLYNTALGRDSEAAGKKAWTDYLTAGKATGAEAAKQFMICEEFKNRKLSNDEFLKVVYKTFFDREPDTDGYNAWLNFLVNGYSREGVVCAFAVSDEFQAICDSYGMTRGDIKSTQPRDENPTLTSFVNRIYTKLLDRDAEPDGLNAWTSAILDKTFTVKQAALQFIESDEFKGHNFSTEDYVTHLYRMFFDREPDSAGFKNWVDYINSDKTSRCTRA